MKLQFLEVRGLYLLSFLSINYLHMLYRSFRRFRLTAQVAL